MAWNTRGMVTGGAGGAATGSMFGPWGAAIGGIAGGVMGGLQKDPETGEMVSTLSPEQQNLMRILGPKFSEYASAGPNAFRYQGLTSSPITEGESNIVSNNARLNMSQNSGLEALLNPDINEYNKQFDEYMVNPQMKDFEENVLPGMVEDYRSFGTSYADAAARARLSRLSDLGAQRFSGYQNLLDRIPGASNALNEASKTAAAIQAIPREIKQAGLDKDFENWYKGNSDYINILGNMLGYLGINTMAMEAPQSENSTLGTLADIGSMISAFKKPSPTFTPEGGSPKSLDTSRWR